MATDGCYRIEFPGKTHGFMPMILQKYPKQSYFWTIGVPQNKFQIFQVVLKLFCKVL